VAAEMYRFSPETGNFVAVQQADNCREAADPGEVIAIGASSAASATVFPSGTTAVRVVSTVDCWVEVGAGAVAASGSSFFLPAGSPEYLAARPGWRVAVVQASAGGLLYERPVR